MVPANVDVWVASLEPPPAVASRLSRLLSDDERGRAARFVREQDRARFVAGRAFLRLLLAGELGEAPETLRFRYGPNGKPAVDACPVDFNLAHSGALAAAAVAPRGGGIGVDIERVRPLDDLEGTIRVGFAPAEAEPILVLAGPARLQAFYEAWTRKEALLKALGRGLGQPVPPGDDSAARLAIRRFEPEAACVGAVAAAGTSWTIRPRSWEWGLAGDSSGRPHPSAVGARFPASSRQP
jgi:4'-phosphopantetheinyl transferase